ncbi:MAG: hypothetical protein ABJE10_04800 [bacterium]
MLPHRIETLAKSPYTLDELEAILADEVYRVCRSNLAQVAGEWVGFDVEWLEERICRRTSSPFRMFRRFNARRSAAHSWPEWEATKSGVAELRSTRANHNDS